MASRVEGLKARMKKKLRAKKAGSDEEVQRPYMLNMDTGCSVKLELLGDVCGKTVEIPEGLAARMQEPSFRKIFEKAVRAEVGGMDRDREKKRKAAVAIVDSNDAEIQAFFEQELRGCVEVEKRSVKMQTGPKGRQQFLITRPHPIQVTEVALVEELDILKEYLPIFAEPCNIPKRLHPSPATGKAQ